MINENFIKRIYAQAEEAEIQGLTKISKHLTRQLEKLSENSDQVKSDFDKFAENKLWDMFTTYAAGTTCTHTANFDANQVQIALDHLKKDIKVTFKNLIKDIE